MLGISCIPSNEISPSDSPIKQRAPVAADRRRWLQGGGYVTLRRLRAEGDMQRIVLTVLALLLAFGTGSGKAEFRRL
jgi:hypothetical protein